MGTGPLDDITVIELARALSGPHAGMILADLGARVIKIERPDGGDDTRGWGPPFVKATPEGVPESTYFLSCNRNKESVTLDLKSFDGAGTVRRLVRHADVVIENFRSGVLERLGLSAEDLLALNPRLVVLSISGFGPDGPDADRTGYDQIAQGEGGLMALTGPEGEPTKVGVPIADLLAGMYGATGVLAALHERTRTGRGQIVRTSLLAAVVGVHSYQGTRVTVAGQAPAPSGRYHSSICPYGRFDCAGGSVQIAVGSDRLWQRFAPAFGIDRRSWATNTQRVEDRDAVVAAVNHAFGPWSPDDLLDRLDALGVPSGRVRSLPDVYAWDQTKSQGLLVDVEHASLGTITIPGPPLRMESARTQHTAPPTLGQHNRPVAAWLDSLPE